MVTCSFTCTYAVHIISFCISFLSRVEELNKLACSFTTNAEDTGSNPVEAPKNLFFLGGGGGVEGWGRGGAISQLLKLGLRLRWSHLHFICISAVHHDFILGNTDLLALWRAALLDP